MQPHAIKTLEALIRTDYGNTTGIIVQKHGETMYENYFSESGLDTRTHVFSVTKSIVSILIGIAIDQGCIHSVHQKVLDFFPDYQIKRGEKTIQRISLHDMLTMTVPYKYKSTPYTRYFTSSDWVKASLDLLGGKGEIGPFRYAPMIGPDILSGILAKTTGCSVLNFATATLFEPLDINIGNNIVFHSKEEQIAIMKKSNGHGWVADPQGTNTAGWGLFLKTADLAKLGKLMFNQGVWEGQQIVSREWICESTRPHSNWNNHAYGYLWWIIDQTRQSFAALGDGGSTLYVNPARGIVIAMTAQFKPRAKDRIALITDTIEPLLR